MALACGAQITNKVHLKNPHTQQQSFFQKSWPGLLNRIHRPCYEQFHLESCFLVYHSAEGRLLLLVENRLVFATDIYFSPIISMCFSSWVDVWEGCKTLDVRWETFITHTVNRVLKKKHLTQTRLVLSLVYDKCKRHTCINVVNMLPGSEFYLSPWILNAVSVSCILLSAVA